MEYIKNEKNLVIDKISGESDKVYEAFETSQTKHAKYHKRRSNNDEMSEEQMLRGRV